MTNGKQPVRANEAGAVVPLLHELIPEIADAA